MNKIALSLLGLLILAGCAGSVETAGSQLRDLGSAPELTNTVWLNTDQPLRLADLRGKVVPLRS